MVSAKNLKAKKRLRKNHPEDIIQLILADHKPIKKLIQVLRNSDKPIQMRKEAFIEFAALLTIHAKAEEQSI